MNRKTINKFYKYLCGYSPFQFTVSISITDLCNKYCDFCHTHSKLVVRGASAQSRIYEGEKSKVISLDNLETIMDKLYFGGVKLVHIVGRGEPLLHPNFYDCICVVNKYLPFTVTTNGILLDTNQWLLDVDNLTEVHISNNYDVVKHPKIRHYTTYVKGETGNAPVFYVPGLENIAVLPRSFSKSYVEDIGCIIPFNNAQVDIDGNVYLCICSSAYKVGNLLEESFWKIVNGKKAREFRKDIYSTNRPLSDCISCGSYRDKVKYYH